MQICMSRRIRYGYFAPCNFGGFFKCFQCWTLTAPLVAGVGGDCASTMLDVLDVRQCPDKVLECSLAPRSLDASLLRTAQEADRVWREGEFDLQQLHKKLKGISSDIKALRRPAKAPHASGGKHASVATDTMQNLTTAAKRIKQQIKSKIQEQNVRRKRAHDALCALPNYVSSSAIVPTRGVSPCGHVTNAAVLLPSTISDASSNCGHHFEYSSGTCAASRGNRDWISCIHEVFVANLPLLSTQRVTASNLGVPIDGNSAGVAERKPWQLDMTACCPESLSSATLGDSSLHTASQLLTDLAKRAQARKGRKSSSSAKTETWFHPTQLPTGAITQSVNAPSSCSGAIVYVVHPQESADVHKSIASAIMAGVARLLPAQNVPSPNRKNNEVWRTVARIVNRAPHNTDEPASNPLQSWSTHTTDIQVLHESPEGKAHFVTVASVASAQDYLARNCGLRFG